MYIQHSFGEPMLQTPVPSSVMLKVVQLPNEEQCFLQKEMLKKQYSGWFYLQANKDKATPLSRYKLLKRLQKATPLQTGLTKAHLISKNYMCLFGPRKTQEVQPFKLVRMQRAYNSMKMLSALNNDQIMCEHTQTSARLQGRKSECTSRKKFRTMFILLKFL